jgi:hypothetical protein
MPHTGVAFQAIQSAMRLHKGIHKILVAIKAISQCDSTIQFRDTNGFVEFAGGKRKAVVPSVDPFDQQFPRKIVRRMATVAGGYGLMCAMVPAVENTAHDMAVGASFRVVLEVRQSRPVIEGKASQTGYPSSQSGKPQQRNQ